MLCNMTEKVDSCTLWLQFIILYSILFVLHAMYCFHCALSEGLRVS
jgi:hypothetical protein